MIRTLLVAMLFAALPVQAGEQLLPVDGAVDNPDFFAFRAELMGIIVRRDADALLDIVHPDIRNSFGGNDGVEEFREIWKPEQPDSELWQELGRVLALGGEFTAPDTFVAPYPFTTWPDGIDAFTHIAVIGSDVPLRTRPDHEADVIATADFGILEYEWSPDDWLKVRLEDGRDAHVERRHLRSPIDYRAMFRRIDGEWRLVFFLAGD